jgi:hypothetical protein
MQRLNKNNCFEKPPITKHKTTYEKKLKLTYICTSKDLLH